MQETVPTVCKRQAFNDGWYAFTGSRFYKLEKKFDIFSCKIFAYYQIIPTFAVRIEERKQMRTFTVNTYWWWRLGQLKQS